MILSHFDNICYGPIAHRVPHETKVRNIVVKEYISNLHHTHKEHQQRSVYTHTFNRRITSLAWHKNEPFLLAAASKSGDIVIVRPSMSGCVTDRIFEKTLKINGGGAGGAIFSMKFPDNNSSSLYRASLDGTVSKLDLQKGVADLVFENTQNYSHWFTAMDVSCSTHTLLVGDNLGRATQFTTQGEKVNSWKLHTSKIHHCEFNPKLPYLLATSSTSCEDNVKLWDLRNLKPKEPLAVFCHKRAVNVAHFNPLNGSRLLTNDQNDEIRVYQGPLWKLKQTIKHDHRQFQHLTAIKASWHPLCDIIVIGHYPLQNITPKTIQFFDADNGEELVSLKPPENKICSLNEFNPTGEVLATGMSSRLVIWKPKVKDEEVTMNKIGSNVTKVSSTLQNILRGRRRSRVSSDEENLSEDDDPKKKMKRKKESVKRSKSDAKKKQMEDVKDCTATIPRRLRSRKK